MHPNYESDVRVTQIVRKKRYIQPDLTLQHIVSNNIVKCRQRRLTHPHSHSENTTGSDTEPFVAKFCKAFDMGIYSVP